MALSSLAGYRNLLLATHNYKNEGPARFFGYIGPNGRVLEAKECFSFQDSFVHPQGALARTAMLRDVSGNNVKYGNQGLIFYSTTVGASAAGTSYTCTAPGRIVGLFVDNLTKAAGGVVDLKTTFVSGSAATVLSSAYTVPGGDAEAYDISANLLGHAGSSYVSGTPTFAAPTALTSVAIDTTADTLTPASTAGVPYVAGDQVTLSSIVTSTGISATTYYVGAVTATSFKLYTTLAGALAGGATALVNITGSNGTCTVTAALRADGAAATAAGSFVAEAQSSISANNGKPVRFTISNGGCGYNTVPSITYPGGVGSGIITKGYTAGGRLTAVDVHHNCDVLPGTVISFPNDTGNGWGATGSSARVTVAIAPFSA